MSGTNRLRQRHIQPLPFDQILSQASKLEEFTLIYNDLDRTVAIFPTIPTALLMLRRIHFKNMQDDTGNRLLSVVDAAPQLEMITLDELSYTDRDTFTGTVRHVCILNVLLHAEGAQLLVFYEDDIRIEQAGADTVTLKT
ncbi:hypothetical protein N0V95_007812 [Ascochyta clinopodiicola]|nr:hypothetical protein N0V95_007812 [Ascochyta clinopodiicola]